MTTSARFWRFVQFDPSGCWEWTGHRTTQGYGQFWDGRQVQAHRWSYALLNGIPDGPLDHLCRNRGCVNPVHLEVVTQTENNRRGISPWAVNARKSHCVRGHAFTAENTVTRQGRRRCRTCHEEYQRAWNERRRK